MTTKEEVKQLWRLCFDDSEAFIDLYFRLRYTDDVNMMVRHEGGLIAALQMLPYTLTFLYDEFEAAYISGACTHPDFRGKGIMGALLNDSFKAMAARHIPLSFLIPADEGLYEYYARFGYISAFFRQMHTVHLLELPAQNEVLMFEYTQVFSEEWFDYFVRIMSRRTNCIQHSQPDMMGILEDLSLANGQVVIARNAQHQVVGLLFAAASIKSVRVLEVVVDSESVQDALFQEIARFYKKDVLTYTTSASYSDTDVRFGMVRIIDAPVICTQYAKIVPDDEMEFVLADPEIQTNNAHYRLNGGKCVVSTTYSHDVPMLTIEQLSARLFNKNRLYMSLMLD